MLRRFFIKWRRSSARKYNSDIAPDEIFLDASNLPKNDMDQFEGRLERPITSGTLWSLGIVIIIIMATFFGRVWFLQIWNGETYAKRSEDNRLRQTLVFAERGVIYDKNDKPLAWNVIDKDNLEFAKRAYITTPGLSSLLGYVKYPMKDKQGFYFSDVLEGKSGLEKYFNNSLSGENGERIIEVNAVGKIQSESTIRLPKNGSNLNLTVDAGLQSKIYDTMDELANRIGFAGGSGVIMDVRDGSLLTMVNYPEYSSQVMTDGSDTAKIKSYLNNSSGKPFLDRAIDGLYTPGSIVKPFMALAGLTEKTIDPNKKILSTGQLVIPNPYDKTKPSIFRDWTVHGWIDMREAISQSSDEYFYRLGGGFPPEKVEGLGILKIDKYMTMFGFGQPLKGDFFRSASGTIPTPEWKAANFTDGTWRLGDTYHTSIGQYGFQVSPIQIARAVSILVNNGKIVEPKIIASDPTVWTGTVAVDPTAYKVVKEGMRMAVQVGTAKALDIEAVKVAAKTGTAEIDEGKIKVNSWVIGFFPYDNPHYVFVFMMEKGPRSNIIGATSMMRTILDWIAVYRSEYFK